ncbi:MAG: hypothetical protein A4E66_01468 [Syntrophus sp. PtaB.Bin001]|nr:MAG: hypothetical protein A4E66_01468 [Syntrophus sp. PtaB.Bin001]
MVEHTRLSALGEGIKTEPYLIFGSVVIIARHMVTGRIGTHVIFVGRIGQCQAVDVIMGSKAFRPLITARGADGLAETVGIRVTW